MRIGIIGTRGIPNNYGGFEQFASRLAPGLVGYGAEVWVYTPHHHPYREPQWKGVNLISCYDPEVRAGTAGQFVYDLNCILDSRSRRFDILLQLGYTSNSIWSGLLDRSSKVVTNMDGLEWKRSKYSPAVRKFLRYAEKRAVRSSDLLIGDSEVICQHLKDAYGVNSTFIPYGADIIENPGHSGLAALGIEPGNYFLIIARLQEDANIMMLIKGVLASASRLPLVIVGNVNSKFARKLQQEYASENIIFMGGIFDMDLLNQLRYNALLYFHGHMSGGTNPSLLEAMAASSPICAHNNLFNRSVLNENAWYFTDAQDVKLSVKEAEANAFPNTFIPRNLENIKRNYKWQEIIQAYYKVFCNLV